MGVRATLAVLLLFIAIVEATDGGVEFWREDFTMTCPEDATWHDKKGEELSRGQQSSAPQPNQYTLKYDGRDKGLFYCEYPKDDADAPTQTTKTKYYFYVKGKACKDCFELDARLLIVVIVVDVSGTAILMIFIYRCTKKKSSAQPTHTPKAPARSGGRAPPVPSPDYESLNVQTRSQDPYSLLNRTG